MRGRHKGRRHKSGYESSSRYTKVYVRRLNTGELHCTYGLILQERTTRYEIPSRIVN